MSRQIFAVVLRYLSKALYYYLRASSHCNYRDISNQAFTLLPQQQDNELLNNTIEVNVKRIPAYRCIRLGTSRNSENLIEVLQKTGFTTGRLDLLVNINDFLERNPKRIFSIHALSIWSTLGLMFSNSCMLSLTTSGSSGTPLQTYSNRATIAHKLFEWLAILKQFGWHEGDRILLLVQSSRGTPSGMVTQLAKYLGFQAVVFRVLDENSCQRIASVIDNVKPYGIIGFPSYFLDLARFMSQADFVFSHNLAFLWCSGEAISACDRKIVESAFQCSVRSVYGMNEVGTIAVECEKMGVFHILEDWYFVENDASNEIVVTTLTKRAVSLMRYRTGDKGKIFDGTCMCGVNGKRIVGLIGRTSEFLINRDGNKLYASFVRQVLDELNESTGNTIISARLFQKGCSKVTIELVLSRNNYTNSFRRYVESTLSDSLNLRTHTEMVTNRSAIDGKRRLIVRYD